MVTVEYDCSGRGIRLEVDGHAGYGRAMGLPAGGDIVCAAVSMVSLMAVQRVLEMEAEGKVTVLEADASEGHVSVRADPVGWGWNQELEATGKTLQAGFELLADRYPDFVALKRGGGTCTREVV